MNKQKATKTISIYFICYVLLFYVLGIIVQLKSPTYTWDGVKAKLSFNPIFCYIKTFTSLFGWICVIVSALIGFVVFFMLVRNPDEAEGTLDARNFVISNKGEYGTAHWMNDEERAKCLFTGSIEETQGNIIGFISQDKSFIDNGAPSATFNYSNDIPKAVVNKNVVSIPTKTRLGPHVAIFGASGSGKSYCFSRNLVFQCADRGESMIITDPKGELYNDTSIFLRRMGYTVKQFNLKNALNSDSWNCLQECTSQGEEGIQLLVQQLSRIIIDNTTPPGGSGGGDSAFFDAAEESLLNSLCLYTLLEKNGDIKPDTTSCLGDVYNILTDRAQMEKDFNDLKMINPDHPALKSYGGYVSGSDNVRGNIVTGLANRLQVMQVDIIQEITGYNDIDLALAGKQKCAYFIILSDQEATLKFLASLFFTFLFVRLVNYADSTPSQKCAVPVNMIMDEFPNIGIIPDFTKKISTVRSRDIRIIIIFQNLAQLEERYPNGQWQEILGNCDTQLCLGVRDEKTAEYLSKKTGEATIFQKNKSTKRKTIRVTNFANDYNESESLGKRFLMTPDEIQKLKSNKLLAFIAGQQPLILDKYGYPNHPDAANLTVTDFMQHIPMWRNNFDAKKQMIKEKAKRNSSLTNEVMYE